jgi:glycerol dehydrogenase-like iron-containing ADH family enzyme
VAVITGAVVKARAGDECRASLEKASIKSSWHVVSDASTETVSMLQDKMTDQPDFVIGFGGGAAVPWTSQK